ncbi:hypothetical protein [Streptomyces sp. NPDC001675]
MAGAASTGNATSRDSVELSGVSCSTAAVMDAEMTLLVSWATTSSRSATPARSAVDGERSSSRSSPSHCCCAAQYSAYGTSFSATDRVRPGGATVSHAEAGGAGASGHISNQTVLRSPPLCTP